MLTAEKVIEHNVHPGPGPVSPGGALRLGLLQGFQLQCAEGEVDIPLSSQRVLAFLALQLRPQTRPHVAATLWMDFDEERAGANLRSALWRINRCGHPLVAADARALRLMPDVRVDLRESAGSAQRVLRGEAKGGAVRVDDLTVGDLLPGWYDDWVVTEREHFRQLRLHALEKLCDQLTDEGRFGQAVQAGLAAVSSEPLRESAHRALIRAYLTEGNRGEAIRQYEACREVLRRELGIEPSPVTRALLAPPPA
jgi:DNA-binding SARP family transcriptional activator